VKIPRGSQRGIFNPIGKSVTVDHRPFISTRVTDIRVNKKKAADLAAFFNEEERRGVKRTCLFALDNHIGHCDKLFSFFLCTGVFACLRTGDACGMNRESAVLPCSP